MAYRLLADLVLFVHASFVVFVVFGGLLVLRRPRAAWIHVPAALWGAGIEIMGGICPLTPLENHLRELAGQQTYPGDFVAHYVLQLLYPDGLTHPVQLLLGAGVLVVNAMLYGAILWRVRRGRS